MAQNRNGSEPFVVCGEKGQKVMWSMGGVGKKQSVLAQKGWFGKRRKDGIDCQYEWSVL